MALLRVCPRVTPGCTNWAGLHLHTLMAAWPQSVGFGMGQNKERKPFRHHQLPQGKREGCNPRTQNQELPWDLSQCHS